MLRPDTDSVIVSMTVVAAAILAAIVAAVVWWETPELHVDTSSRPAVAHMELLGDYPSDIRTPAATSQPPSGRSLRAAIGFKSIRCL